MMRISLFLTVFLIGMNAVLSQMENDRINGMSIVSINGAIDSSHVFPVKSMGANWAAVIPFAYMPSSTSPKLSFDLKWQWKGERLEGMRNSVQEFHAQGISVMMKPQIWIGHGVYTGELNMKSDEDWVVLEENYSKYILAFTELAIEENVEMICLGTEIRHFAEKRPEYWKGLISEVREIYSGKLTYAANWDDYQDVPFWEELDYIGVDAYFPVAEKEKCTREELVEGWKSHKSIMDDMSRKFNHPILFTEYGYRSITDCAIKPWDYSKSGKPDEKAQQTALQALYDVFWQDNLYAGGFLWKWYPNNERAGGAKDEMFTVQNKKAKKTVKEIYSK